MKPAPFGYRRVLTVPEAVAALAGGHARVLAGGQSLVQELSARSTTAELLVDVGGVSELDFVDLGAALVGRPRSSPPTPVDAPSPSAVVRIGALRRIAAIEHDRELAGVLPALVEAAARIAYPAVRNRGTVGGNVAHADPASGIPPVLLAHDGEIVLAGPAGERVVAATAFFTGYRTTAAGPDELVTELRFPRPAPGTGAAFAEISRRAAGWGLAGACAVVRLDGDAIVDLRIGLLGLAPTAVRADAAERDARGRPADAATIAALADAAVADLDRIPADIHASSDLRRSLGRVAVRRALTEATARAAGA